MNGPLTNTATVWQALFLREALDRFFGSRAAWSWLIIEPAMHIGFMSAVWGMMRRNSMGGIDVSMWIILGMLSFFLFRRTAVQTLHALDCNKAFFAFRQVRPFVAVRPGLRTGDFGMHAPGPGFRAYFPDIDDAPVPHFRRHCPCILYTDALS